MTIKVVTGSEDSTAKVWEIDDKSQQHIATYTHKGPAEGGEPHEGHSAGITSVAVNSRGDHVMTTSRDKTIKIWDVPTSSTSRHRGLRATFPKVKEHGHQDYVNTGVWCKSGQYADHHILTSSDDHSAAIWDTKAGTLVCQLRDDSSANAIGHTGPVTMATFDRDASKVLTCSQDRSCIIWTAAGGQFWRCLPSVYNTKDQHQGPVWSAVWSPESTEILTASRDKTAKLWDSTTTQCTSTFTRHKDGCLNAVYSPKENWTPAAARLSVGESAAQAGNSPLLDLDHSAGKTDLGLSAGMTGLGFPAGMMDRDRPAGRTDFGLPAWKERRPLKTAGEDKGDGP